MGLSEQIILHFDSLRQGHDSNAIFDILKRYLVSLGANKHYEVRIKEILQKQVSVPLQDNGYDCGIFLLFYVKKFLEDAPQKLIFQNLDEIFNHNWFPVKQTSNLREKIQEVMLEEFATKKEFTNNLTNGPLSKILDVPVYNIREPKVNIARDIATRKLITSDEFITHVERELAAKLEKNRVLEEGTLSRAILKKE
ncbi:hypothetical protein KC19_VG080600 [Ceratodon purpureus]|uniref:Ubiquitin-like protease family profile domain-containing protein n=1 Tax=Ceratodon purpureus TaxID=3225 RepID=A0A8T0HN03_CERPU|nr:hypothetical protein KC19_VG080600 [Ceratodon purpureus]